MFKNSAKSLICACAILVEQATSNSVHAASLAWRDAPYDYAVVNQGVVDVLTNFGYNTGLRMSIGSDVTGAVRGRVDAKTAGAFLDAITKANNLDWYFDGSVMYVSTESSEKTLAVSLHDASFAKVKAALERSGLTDERYTIIGNSAGFATISGPPSYVAVIKQAIEAEGTKDASLVIYRGAQSTSVKFP